MAYCTKEQVADEFNAITAFASTTNPTDTTVDRWIAEADALINAKVGLRYVTPISNATDLIVIRMISVMLVSARVRRRLNRTGPEGEPAKVKVADTDSKAMKMLDEIIKGLIDLPGSTLLSTGGGVKSYLSSTDCYEHKFKMGKDQW